MGNLKNRVEMWSVEDLKEHPQNKDYNYPLNEFEKQIKKMRSKVVKWQDELMTYTEIDFGHSSKIESVLKTLQNLSKQIEKMEGVLHG